MAFSSSFIFLATSQIAFQNTFMTLNYHGRYRYTTLMGFIFGYIVVFTWLILRSKDNYSILILYSILLLLESLDVFVCRVQDTIFSGSTSIQYHIILRLCILTTASYTMFGGFPAFSILIRWWKQFSTLLNFYFTWWGHSQILSRRNTLF